MAQPGPPSSSHPDPSRDSARREPYGDPWQAFAYLVSGVLFYGICGWLLDRWLETRFLVVVGIFLGAALGIYMCFGRFGPRARGEQPRGPRRQNQQDQEHPAGDEE